MQWMNDFTSASAGDLTVRLVFLVELLLLAIIRVYFHAKTGTLKESPFSAAEGKLLSTLRLLAGLTCVTSLLIALTFPALLAATTVELPLAIRATGPALFGAGLLGLIWVHQTLGRNFSPTLHVREGNHLVTEGPYRYVRHPMYTVMVGCVTAMVLATGDAIVATSGVATMSIVIFFRTPKEEDMMVEEFGDEYVRYRTTTGAIFPRFFRASADHPPAIG